ncbi:MAG: hypothetical protein J1E41_03755, partial [Ruminococcus sp.]|nr:hypothetical protein [Ruminococcus sp.]
MRRKVWTTGPWFLIFSALILAMAAATFQYSFVLFVIEVAVSLASIFVLIFSRLRFKKYIDKTVATTISNISDVNQTYLERFKMPVVVVGKFGDILWSNSRFKKQLCLGRNPVNENISVYLNSRNVDDIADSDGIEIDFDGHHYAVFFTSADEGYIGFFIDNTHYN